jgi:DNA polymerase III sliding clamp (beta) subunit (PCNA family)
MTTIIQTKALQEVLNKVKPGIASKTIVESMTYFYFSGEEIITYNDKISVLHPLKTDFTLFVKANDLIKLLSVTKAEELKLTEKNSKLNIKGKAMNVNLNAIIDEEITERMAFIKESMKEELVWNKLPENFISAAKLCSFAASKTEGDFTTSCLFVHDEEIIATDNSRVAIAKLSEKMPKMFLKASEINNLASINPALYLQTKAWIHFKNDQGCIFSIRRIEGDFPDFTSIINFEGIKIKLPSSILEGTDIASIFIDSLAPAVSLKLTKGFCEVSIQSEGGSSQFRSKLKYDGEDVTFTINPAFLKEMLNHSTSIFLNDVKATKAKLSTENFTLVTCLYGN